MLPCRARFFWLEFPLMHLNIDWQAVDTVLLDMDGTLLDLAFDNYFWQKLVP
ncbi:nucleotidase, partial [Microbacterium sp. SUBG005]